LYEIQSSNYDIFASKMFTMTPPCQSPELDGIVFIWWRRCCGTAVRRRRRAPSI
jgi:hypothetical protein